MKKRKHLSPFILQHFQSHLAGFQNLQRNVAPSERRVLFPDRTTNDYALRIAKGRKRSQLAQFLLMLFSTTLVGSILILWVPPNGFHIIKNRNDHLSTNRRQLVAAPVQLSFQHFCLSSFCYNHNFSLFHLRGTQH